MPGCTVMHRIQFGVALRQCFIAHESWLDYDCCHVPGTPKHIFCIFPVNTQKHATAVTAGETVLSLYSGNNLSQAICRGLYFQSLAKSKIWYTKSMSHDTIFSLQRTALKTLSMLPCYGQNLLHHYSCHQHSSSLLHSPSPVQSSW